jgi:hypothetical protein
MVVLLVSSTILTISKFSCNDWNMQKHIADKMDRLRQIPDTDPAMIGVPCWISLRLKAICSEYPTLNKERNKGSICHQDLYVWLDFTDEELEAMKAWNLVPCESNEGWWQDYSKKRKAREAVLAAEKG